MTAYYGGWLVIADQLVDQTCHPPAAAFGWREYASHRSTTKAREEIFGGNSLDQAVLNLTRSPDELSIPGGLGFGVRSLIEAGQRVFRHVSPFPHVQLRQFGLQSLG